MTLTPIILRGNTAQRKEISVKLNSISHHINLWCAKNNKSQKDLADLLSTTPACVSRWKAGALPSMKSIYKLSLAIEVPVDELLAGVDFGDVPKPAPELN